MAKKYNLYDIPLKQAFANSGLTQRVPYQLNPKDDDLNWLEGFTDAYQRPVLADDTQQGNGRYIKMGQLNQVLQNLSQAILNVKQGLDNVSGKLDDKFQAQIDKIVADAEHTLANPVIRWLQTKNNQNCAGLKNFTGVNINNFKTTPAAVANLGWCNGLPIQSVANFSRITGSYTTTVRQKNIFYTFLISINGFRGKGVWQIYINEFHFGNADSYGEDRFANEYSPVVSQYVRNKDVLKLQYQMHHRASAFSYLGS